jgi:hypothetical protein
MAGGPARNALKPVWSKFNHLSHKSMISSIQRAMHGRRACPQCLETGVWEM